MSATTVKIGKITVNLSNLEKVLYPQAGFTKGQVVEYHLKMAPIIVPHVKNRPLTLKRYPNGVDGMMFYEKRCPPHKPDWIKTVTVTSRREGGKLSYCVIDSPAALVWVANLASLELHTLLFRGEQLYRPTWMVFDFDPGPPAGILECIPIALKVRDTLERLKLKSFIKTSGGKGLHMVVPLNTPVTFDQTKGFSNAIARMMERDDPDHVTSNMKKELRKGKIFIDWSQNDEHKTTVAVYSLRARNEPTVSTPVEWDELTAALKKKDPDKLKFLAPQVIKRVDKIGDLFAPVLKLKQKLPAIS
ncbi:MAG TPA: non-homologous end-joining DNA ligase [Tepidisphaeraceae bacterium]|jgi:bifunctional non-homologous end joining protein LigD|nr:non-homologous end-joining DNA ligase [Tepidisphaeraceae bacterium]